MKIKELYLTMSKYVDKLLVLKNLRVKLKTCLKDRIDSSALFWKKKNDFTRYKLLQTFNK